MSLQQALDGDSAVVAEEFLIRLNARWARRCGWAAELQDCGGAEAGAGPHHAGAGMGPRVMISQAALARTGLLAPGSRASQRLLMKLPPQGRSRALRKQVEAALPDAQVMDFREGNPGLSQGLDNATAILSLICLVAMVLGAIGVAMAMHAHLEQRMDMLAILKAGRGFGRSAAHLSVANAGAGAGRRRAGRGRGRGRDGRAAGGLRQSAAGSCALEFPWRSVAAGLGTGLLTTLLFCLPPLLDVRA
jgi:putative ABC transport system permease protein